MTIKDLNDKNITNVVLGNVTIATATDPAAGKNLIIGSDGVDDQRFSDAEALPGSIGSRDIVLGAEGSGVAVVGGHYLTLVGGDASTSLISAGSGGEKPVDVLVGGSVNGQASEGTLNLGTQAMSSGGTLKGNVQLAASSTLNVRAGEIHPDGRIRNAGPFWGWRRQRRRHAQRRGRGHSARLDPGRRRAKPTWRGGLSPTPWSFRAESSLSPARRTSGGWRSTAAKPKRPARRKARPWRRMTACCASSAR